MIRGIGERDRHTERKKERKKEGRKEGRKEGKEGRKGREKEGKKEKEIGEGRNRNVVEDVASIYRYAQIRIECKTPAFIH